MAATFQLMFQRTVVVVLAVENNGRGITASGHRLMPAGQIDNRKPAHANRCRALYLVACVVRAPVFDDVAHPHKNLAGRDLVANFILHKSGDATHCSSSLAQAIQTRAQVISSQVVLMEVFVEKTAAAEA